MQNSYRRKLNNSIIIIAIGVVAGLLYPTLSRELDDPFKVLNGAIIGFFGSGFIVINEIWIRQMVIRRLKFSTLIIVKFIQYATFFILLIILVISLDRSRRFDMGIIDYWYSPEFTRLIWKEDFFIIVAYALIGTIIFILLYLIGRKMGQGILWSFIIGKYHKPRAEHRIFMYLDLNQSTTIAESLGDVKFHKLLNQFFYDITDSLVLNYGKIYRYIGDEVIVSWSVNKGLKNANYLNAFFDAKEQIKKNEELYRSSYGLVPEFSAAIHMGEVVTGELGEVKSEIIYLGETLHETSIIEKACSQFSAKLLISRILFDRTKIDKSIEVKSEHRVRINDSEQIDVVELHQV